MKVAKPTTRPRRTLDEDVEMAALVLFVVEDPDGNVDGAGVLVAYELVDEVFTVLSTLKSLG